MWITQATSNKLGNANVSIYTSKHSGTYGINKEMKWSLSLQQIVDGKCKFFATVQVTNRHKITENCT